MNHTMSDKFDDAFRPRAYRAGDHRPSEHRPHEPTTSPPRHSEEPSGSGTTTAVSQADGSPWCAIRY